jgi:hypothetical protein
VASDPEETLQPRFAAVAGDDGFNEIHSFCMC